MDSRAFKRRMLGCAGSPLIVALGALLLIGCTEEPPDLPEHAFVYYGDEWKCERGFKRVEERCEEIQVPENAFLTVWGDGWECERGFQRRGDHCARE